MRTLPWGHTGTEVSVIGQGTWNIETYDKAEAIRAIHRGIELGMRHVDTAYDYGYGASEAFLGEALEGKREEVFLVSKVLPQVATYEGTIKACEYSLGRLRTDRLDCLLLHWWEGLPLADTFRAFERLVEDGKILSYGVSNFTLDEIEQAHALGKLACHQIVYNLQTRDIERAMLAWCRDRGIAVVGYAPYGDVRQAGTLFPDTLARAPGVLEAIAHKHGVSTRNVAAAFLLREDVFIIPKGERREFAEDNARAADLALDDEDLAAIDRAFPCPPERPIPFTNPWYAAQKG